MKRPLIAIYRTHLNDWRAAYTWAMDNNIDCRVYRDECFKGINLRATLYWSDNEKIEADYISAGVERWAPDEPDDGEE